MRFIGAAIGSFEGAFQFDTHIKTFTAWATIVFMICVAIGWHDKALIDGHGSPGWLEWVAMSLFVIFFLTNRGWGQKVQIVHMLLLPLAITAILLTKIPFTPQQIFQSYIVGTLIVSLSLNWLCFGTGAWVTRAIVFLAPFTVMLIVFGGGVPSWIKAVSALLAVASGILWVTWRLRSNSIDLPD